MNIEIEYRNNKNGPLIEHFENVKEFIWGYNYHFYDKFDSDKPGTKIIDFTMSGEFGRRSGPIYNIAKVTIKE